MQSKEMRSQNGAAETAGTGISGWGYQELNRLNQEEKSRLKEQYQTDLVGTLSELPAYLGMELWESKEETRVFQKLIEAVQDGKDSYDARDAILCLANEYGMAAEESGFRRGFQIAMRLCMEGLKGGVC